MVQDNENTNSSVPKGHTDFKEVSSIHAKQTITIRVDADVWKEFRQILAKRLMIDKGNQGVAITEALQLWIDETLSESHVRRRASHDARANDKLHLKTDRK